MPNSPTKTVKKRDVKSPRKGPKGIPEQFVVHYGERVFGKFVPDAGPLGHADTSMLDSFRLPEVDVDTTRSARPAEITSVPSSYVTGLDIPRVDSGGRLSSRRGGVSKGRRPKRRSNITDTAIDQAAGSPHQSMSSGTLPNSQPSPSPGRNERITTKIPQSLETFEPSVDLPTAVSYQPSVRTDPPYSTMPTQHHPLTYHVNPGTYINSHAPAANPLANYTIPITLSSSVSSARNNIESNSPYFSEHVAGIHTVSTPGMRRNESHGGLDLESWRWHPHFEGLSPQSRRQSLPDVDRIPAISQRNLGHGDLTDRGAPSSSSLQFSPNSRAAYFSPGSSGEALHPVVRPYPTNTVTQSSLSRWDATDQSATMDNESSATNTSNLNQF